MSPQNKPREEVIIGKVGRPHGLRGELRVFTESEQSEALAHISTIILTLPDGSKRTHELRRAKPSQRFWIVSFKGVDDRNLAQELNGAQCSVFRDHLPAISDDEFYYHDVIGLPVKDPEGADLGQVLEIFSNGAHDVLVYGPSRSKTFMVPLISDFVEDIDVDLGYVTIHPMELD